MDISISLITQRNNRMLICTEVRQSSPRGQPSLCFAVMKDLLILLAHLVRAHSLPTARRRNSAVLAPAPGIYLYYFELALQGRIEARLLVVSTDATVESIPGGLHYEYHLVAKAG